MKPWLGWENWGGVPLQYFHGEKDVWKQVHSTSFQGSLYIPFPPGKHWREAPPYFPHKYKRLINHSFCRNWAVRNHTGTRLDSLAWWMNKMQTPLFQLWSIFLHLVGRLELLWRLLLLLHHHDHHRVWWHCSGHHWGWGTFRNLTRKLAKWPFLFVGDILSIM